jgi:hypothetical protein
VVSRAAGLADMLMVTEGADSESHCNDTARELLRGLLIYVAGLPDDRRSMAELRRIVTASGRLPWWLFHHHEAAADEVLDQALRRAS